MTVVKEGTLADQEYTREEFQEMLDAAEGGAKNDWEIEFVSGLQAKLDRYGLNMFFTPKQREILERIAG